MVNLLVKFFTKKLDWPLVLIQKNTEKMVYDRKETIWFNKITRKGLVFKRIYVKLDYFWFKNTLCCCKKRKRTAATNKGCKVLLTIPKAINTRSWDTSKLISKSIKHPVHILRNTKECWSIHRKLYRNLDRMATICYFR